MYWFAKVNRQKITLQNKITYFLKKHVASLFTFFEKVFAICIFYTARFLDVRFWDLLYFIRLKFSPQYWYLLLRREKMCWFSSYFKQGKGRNFCSIFRKSQNLCLHKIFETGSTTLVNCREFYFFILDVKCTLP